jgi:hypothetical protein
MIFHFVAVVFSEMKKVTVLLHDLVRFMDKVLVAFVVPFIPINVANLD